MTTTIFEDACANASTGMEIAAVAARDPQRIAVESKFGNLTFAELNAGANRVARLMRESGVEAGDAVALVCGNRPEFVIVRFACHRIGARLTPVNWHLASEEMAYIVDNCEAKVLFTDVRIGEQQAVELIDGNQQLAAKIAIGGDIAGYQNWEVSDRYDNSNIDDPCLGTMMLYTSGTTGRPKGVLRKQPDPQKAADMQSILTAVFQFDPESGTDRAITPGPLYHSGPFNLCMTTPLTSGIGTVLMDKWDTEEVLRIIDSKKITHVFFVPTMFVRLLQLGETVRKQYDVSSMKFIIHGAAPCSRETKQAMLDWFGPIIWEMFAGTEGPGTIVSPQEWLAKPGTVGKPAPGQMRILDEDGKALAAGETGQVYIVNPADSTFSYFKDEDKTNRAIKDGYFTAGDMGYIDEDGYLFLTGRSAEVIISGGVNIYPQEIDDVLALHDSVTDVACVGIPNEEWGEEIRAVVELRAGVEQSKELEEELLEFVRPKLAKQKWPRAVDFVDSMPRSQAGKILRRAIREQYWQNQEKKL